MKIFLVLLVAATSRALPTVHEQWATFKITHQKEYNSTVEELERLAIFAANLAQIEEHNAKFEKGQVTYSKALNQFADMTKEEFLAYVNKGKLHKPNIPEKIRKEFVPSKQPVAAQIDWRARGAVGEVKNQGQCGSCWSFSATGAIEGQLAINQGNLVSLSEQNLIDCSTEYGNQACDGGFMDQAFQYVYDYGIESERDYPYEAQLNYCRYQRSSVVTGISGYYDLPSGSEGSLENAVGSVGPVSVAIDATDELQFYAGGVFYDYTCNESDLNHGVLVVGYGSEGGYDYWLVKNSWGASWGEGGYYKAAKNMNNNCGIATAAVYPSL